MPHVEVMDVTTVQVSWNITVGNDNFSKLGDRFNDPSDFDFDTLTTDIQIVYSPVGLSSYTVMPVNNPITR